MQAAIIRWSAQNRPWRKLDWDRKIGSNACHLVLAENYSTLQKICNRTLQLTGNFHSVVAATLYRSAQPSAADIERYHARYRIQTIINLRGENDRASWYQEEVAAAKRLGILHVNFGMSAGRQLTHDQADRLIALFERSEKPVLVHCKAGADRTGLASALYLAAIAKQGERAAEGQISLRYGHISLPFAPAYAMDLTFEALESWLGFPNS